MRVVVITQYFPPERGAVRYAHQLASGLASRGHQVNVITGLPHFPVGSPYEGFGKWKPVIRHEDGVRVVRTPLVMGSNRQPVRRILGFLTFVFSALPWICSLPRQDVVVASVPPVTVSILGVLGSLVHRCPLVVILRDIEPLRSLSLRKMAGRNLGRALVRVFMWLYRRATRIVVVHANEEDVLLRYKIPASRIIVIPHGIDVARYTAPVQGDSFPTLPRRSGRSVALYMGTIGRVHGLASLVKAAADNRIRRLAVDFVIIGDGECRTECLEIVESRGLDNVHILPSVPLEQVPSILVRADILICSFRDDANALLGSKFYEYCAAGKPILVHGRSLAATLVGEIGNGLACSAGDPAGLHVALRDLLSRPQFWNEKGQLGRQYAQKHFSQTMRDGQWENLLKSVAHRR